MTIYLGPVGNLQALPSMGRGIGASLDLGAAVHRSLTGVRTVDYVGTPKRTYTMERRHLTDAEVGIIEGLALGAYGPGPYALLDPWRENLLTANQSTGTDALGDTTGFRVGTYMPGAIVSTETYKVLYGSRSVGWYVSAVDHELFVSTATPGGCDLKTDVPVVGGQMIRFTGWAIAQTGQVNFIPALRFYDRIGNSIASYQGPTVEQQSSIWGQFGVVAVVPESAAVVVPFLATTYMDAAQKVYLDGLSMSVVQGVENMFPNGDFEEAQSRAQGWSVQRVNEHTNPAAQVDLTDWSSYGGTGGVITLSRQTGQTGWWYATTSARATFTTGTTAVSGGLIFGYNGSLRKLPVAAGGHYSAHVQVRCSKSQRLIIGIEFFSSAGGGATGTVYGDVAVVSANTVTTLRITDATAPASSTYALVTIYAAVGTGGSNWAVNDWLEGTHAHFEATSLALDINAATTWLSAPFTGHFQDGGYSVDVWYDWEGTADASRSIMKWPYLPGTLLGGGAAPRVGQTSERAYIGTHSALVRWATAAIGDSVPMWWVRGLEAWQPYVLSMAVYVPTGSPDVRLYTQTGGTGTWHDGHGVTTVKDNWVKVFATFYCGGSVIVGIGTVNGASVLGDDRAYIDDVQVVRRQDWMIDRPLPASPSEQHVPGTGVPRVAFTDLSDTYPIIGSHDVSFTLVEVQ